MTTIIARPADPRPDSALTPADLAARYEALAWRVAHKYRRFLPDGETADDMAQAAWAAIYKAAGRWDHTRTRFVTFAWVYAVNACRSHLYTAAGRGFAGASGRQPPPRTRSLDHHGQTSAAALGLAAPEPGGGREVWDDADWARVLALLPWRIRRAVELQFRDGLTCDEVAAALGCGSRQRAQQLVAKGVGMLRDKLAGGSRVLAGLAGEAD